MMSISVHIYIGNCTYLERFEYWRKIEVCRRNVAATDDADTEGFHGFS